MTHKQLVPMVLAALLTGCAGGQGPAAPAARPQATAAGETAPVTLHIAIPGPTLQAKYVSSATLSVEICYDSCGGRVVTNVTAQASYNITFEAPLGTKTYTVRLYDQNNAPSGANVLAEGSGGATVVRGVSNAFTITPMGIPGAITLALPNARPLINGTPRGLSLNMTVQDLGGGTISGTSFFNPVATATDPAGLGPLFTSAGPGPANAVSVPDSATTISIAYTGGGVQGDVVTYNASANGGAVATPVTLTPTSDIRFPANSNSDTHTISTSSFATQNIDVKQINGTLPVASGCPGTVATVVMTEDAPGDYNAAITPAPPFSGNCSITLTGASADGAPQTGTITFNFLT